MPLGSSMMYSALLVKINRMYRIFYLKLKEKNLMKLKAISVKPAYVDVTSQLLMIACFVGLMHEKQTMQTSLATPNARFQAGKSKTSLINHGTKK